MLSGIQGRADETLYLPGRAGGHVPVHPVVLQRVMESVPASGWQIVHKADGFCINLAALRDGFDETSLLSSLRRALEACGAIPPPLHIERVAAIPKTAAGKAPLIRAARHPDHRC